MEAIIKAPAATPAALTLTAYTGTAVVPVAKGVVKDIIFQYVVDKEGKPETLAAEINAIMAKVDTLVDSNDDEITNAEAVLESIVIEENGTLTVPNGAGSTETDSTLDSAITEGNTYTMTIAADALAGTTNITGGTSNKLTVWQDVDGLRIKLAGPINNEETTVYLTNTDTTNDLVYVLTLKDTTDNNRVVWTSEDITVPKTANGVEGKSDPVVITLPKAATTYALSGEIKSTTGAKVTLTLADNGTIKLNGTTAIATGTEIENLLPGDTVKFTVEPAEGYEVKEVKANSSPVLKPDANGMYTFTKNNTGSPETIVVTMQTIAAGKVAEAEKALTRTSTVEVAPYTGAAAPSVDDVKAAIVAQVKAVVEAPAARAAELVEGYNYEVTEGVTDVTGLTKNSVKTYSTVKVTVTYKNGEQTATYEKTLSDVKVFYLFSASEAKDGLEAALTVEKQATNKTEAQIKEAVSTAVAGLADPTTANGTVAVKGDISYGNFPANTDGAYTAGTVDFTCTVTYNGADYELSGSVEIGD